MVPPLVVPLIVSQFWRGEGGLKGLVLDGGLAAFRVGGLASASNPPVSAQPHGSQSLLGPLRGVGCFQFPDWCFPFPWCFLFPDCFFRFPWCFWFPGLGVSSSWIGVFLAQLLCWCFWFPGLGVFSPGQCVPCPAPVLVCPFTCLFVSFRLNFWLPLPTAGFESTYSCHTIKQTKNTAKPSKPFAGKHVSLRKPTAAKTQGTR